MANHTCKNCGAIEDIETGKLSYNGDNPALKQNEELKKEIFILKQKNNGLSALLSKRNKERSNPNAKKKTDNPEGSPETHKSGGFTFFG